jgi:hypothetical protein
VEERVEINKNRSKMYESELLMGYLRSNMEVLEKKGYLSCGLEECMRVLRGEEVGVVGVDVVEVGCPGVSPAKGSILLPFCAIVEGVCEGIKKNHNLYTQCSKKVVAGEVLCRGCLKQKKNSSTGTPPYGMIRDRAIMGPNYVDPKGNKAVPYANVAKRLGINISDAKKEAARLGWTIPETELIERVSRRGRPKKVKSAAVEDNTPKKRGRPKKEQEKEKTNKDKIMEMVAELDVLEEKHDTPEEEAAAEIAAEIAVEITAEITAEIEEDIPKQKEKYKDGQTVELVDGFNGIVTRINDVQYFITQGSPGDDDGEEYVWTIGEEAECIGIYEDGKIIEIEYDEE